MFLLVSIKSSLKRMRNNFYFVLKTLFVLEVFTFLSWLFDYVEKRLNKKALVIFKIYDAMGWTRKRKPMLLGQIIEYNMRNIFFLKSYIQNMKSKSQILSKYIKTKMLTIWFYLLWFSLENKKRSGTSVPDSFSAWFLKKNVSHIIFY